MKRLFAFALATLVAMCLVSCQQQKEVKLDERVGMIYGTAHGDMAGDGIVFYVYDNGDALICSMNDVKHDRSISQTGIHMWERDFTWSVFGSDTLMERDTIWCEIKRDIKHFVDITTIDDSILPGSIVKEPETFLRYNYTITEDSVMTIYPMLRYKAYTEPKNGQPGVQVCPPFTKDTAYNGFVGELMPTNAVLTAVKVDIFTDTTWKNDTIIIENQKYAISVGDRYDSATFTIYRPHKDSVERRTRTFDTIRGYADTLWNNIKKGDKNFPNANQWYHALDTNYSYSDIKGLTDNGKKNTEIIVGWDVPCRQKIEPDSSSAARACYTYYTNNYYPQRDLHAKDTAYKAGQGEWFLPSREELKKLFDARQKINAMHYRSEEDYTPGFEPLENCYWTSNQRDAKNAWYKCFSDNGVESYIPKANNNYRVGVRAIRKVKLK